MKRPALFSDGDGTIYRWQLAIDWLEELAPLYPKVATILKTAEEALRAYRNRQGSFMDYANLLVQEFWEKRAYIGIKQSDAHAAAKRVAEKNQRRTYVFTRELVAAAQSINWPVIVVSGSPHEAVEEFMRFFGITEILATKHAVDEEGRYTKQLLLDPARNKGPAVREYAEAHNIDLDRSVAIGDSHGDIPMLSIVRYPLCFNPNEALRGKALEESWPIFLEVRDQLYAMRRHSAPKWHTGIPEPLCERLQERLPRSMYEPRCSR